MIKRIFIGIKNKNLWFENKKVLFHRMNKSVLIGFFSIKTDKSKL